jgi:hypothetical protein
VYLVGLLHGLHGLRQNYGKSHKSGDAMARGQLDDFHQLLNTVDGNMVVEMPPKKEFLSWEPQSGESAPAFAAFVEYRDLGPDRSIDAVQRKVKKNTRLLAKWSGHWNWVKRARAYDAHLDEIVRHARETELAKQSRKIASAHEVLEEVSAIALAPIDQFVKVAGKSKRVRLRLGDKLRALYFMGQYWRLLDRGGYSALEDDQEKAKRLLARLVGTKPHLLPPANRNNVEGELLEVDDGGGQKEP